MITSFTVEYRFLSNFFFCPIRIDEFLFPSVENAYQASKTLPMEGAMFEDIPPGQAKRLGGKVVLRPDWDEVKLGIMEDLLRIKFSNPRLLAELLSMGDEELIEGNDWGDRFWGAEFIGEKWVGENHLGKLLMQIRGEKR